MGIDKERLTWTVIFALEMLVVIIGNAMAIVVFWKQRSTLKRTCYLLINLSVADFLVGIGEMINLSEKVIYFKLLKSVVWDGTFLVSDVFAGSASLTFLTFISVERLYAIAWPYRHRTTRTRVYIYCITAAWILTIAVTVIYLCGFELMIINEKITSVINASVMGIDLVVITCSYLAIWISNKKQNPRIQVDRREQSRKLATTLFIVTILSVLTWLPLTVGVMSIGTHQYNELLFNIARFLQLANSYINPIVYYARMPEFRRHLRNMIMRQRNQQCQ